MREHGWATDAWPELFERVLSSDILVIAGPIWLGDNSSETKKVIERLYAHSGELNDRGQWLYYGKVGGCLITGNEDGIKHCASNVLYSLQHIGYAIPPQADAGWIGEAGPGPSYGDILPDGTRIGLENEFTQRNTTFLTWNVLHLARLLKNVGGFPPATAINPNNGTPAHASTSRTPNIAPSNTAGRSSRPRGQRELIVNAKGLKLRSSSGTELDDRTHCRRFRSSKRRRRDRCDRPPRRTLGYLPQ